MNTVKMLAQLRADVKKYAPEKLRLINDPDQELVCLYTREQVDTALQNTAKKIARDLKGQDPIFICLVKGGMLSYSQVFSHLGNDFSARMEYAHPSSYKGGMSSGDFEWIREPIGIDKKSVVF